MAVPLRPLAPLAHAFLADLGGRFQVAVSSRDGVTSVQVLDRSTGAVQLVPAEAAYDDGEVANVSLPAATVGTGG